MIALPIETSDALDALREARTRLGYAVDALHEQGAPLSTTSTFVEAMDAVSWSVERVSVTLARVRSAQRDEDVEERHVDAQIFPWADDL